MLLSSGLPQNLYGEAILLSNYFFSRMSWKKQDKNFMNYLKVRITFPLKF